MPDVGTMREAFLPGTSPGSGGGEEQGAGRLSLRLASVERSTRPVASLFG
jgi:hypothetical protein